MLIVFIALAIAIGAQALGGGLGNTLTNIASEQKLHRRAAGLIGASGEIGARLAFAEA